MGRRARSTGCYLYARQTSSQPGGQLAVVIKRYARFHWPVLPSPTTTAVRGLVKYGSSEQSAGKRAETQGHHRCGGVAPVACGRKGCCSRPLP